jgi:hypothetical protein
LKVGSKNLRQAREAAELPLPLEPYWEGRSYEEALETSILDLSSETARAGLYERLFGLMDRNDPALRDQALTWMSDAFRMERRNKAVGPLTRSAVLRNRLEFMHAEVTRRLPETPELLEEFCSHFTPSLQHPSEIEQFRIWLDALVESGAGAPVPPNALLAARILYGAYGDTWKAAGSRLLAALDQEDRTVRACAAYQIGTFCRRLARNDPETDFEKRDEEADRMATEGMAPLADYWELIRRKEIERSGVAGAFWECAPHVTVDAEEWILTLLEQADPEPFLCYFPCDLSFDAHERFSRKPAAVRRLMEAGRFGVALAAATEANTPVPGMESILIELGDRDDPEFTRLAAWALAYHYNHLHFRGERLGFVRHHAARPDCDLFLLFSKPEKRVNPYAVVVYPKSPQQRWSRKEAQTLTNRIFPSKARGKAQQDAYTDPDRRWYQHGYVNFSVVNQPGLLPHVARVTIGYRSDAPWNPIPAQPAAPAPPSIALADQGNPESPV